MSTALHILFILIGIAACVLVIAALGFIAIIWWLFNSWDEAERKYVRN